MNNKEILSAILLGMTGGNAVVDFVNNDKSSEKEASKIKSSSDNLLKSVLQKFNQENIGKFLDFVTVATVLFPSSSRAFIKYYRCSL